MSSNEKEGRPSSPPISCQRSGSGVCAIRPSPRSRAPERPRDTPTDASLWRGRAYLKRRPSNEREARPHPGSHRERHGVRPGCCRVRWNSMELSVTVGLAYRGRRDPMSSGSAAKEFEAFARDCVQLAAQAGTPELRERLLSMARDWMRAAIEEDDAAPSTNRALRRRRFQPSRSVA